MILEEDIKRLKEKKKIQKEITENISSKNPNELDSIINSLELPEWVLSYALTHHSPSQLNSPDDTWGYKYLELTSKERAALDGNSKMSAGIGIGYAMNLVYTDWLWDGLSKTKCRDYKNDKLYVKKAIEKALTAYRNYKPVNEKDAESFTWNIQGFVLTFDQLTKAFKEIPIKGETHSEKTASLFLPGCTLPTIGRLDLETEDLFIEVKSKWRRRTGKPRSDGTMAHSIVRLELTPEWINQVAFYYAATKKTPYLVAVHENEYKIWHPGNCELLQPDHLESCIEDMASIARRRERMMKRHAGKKTWVQDIQPNFKHPYFWNIGGDHKEKAIKLWKKYS